MTVRRRGIHRRARERGVSMVIALITLATLLLTASTGLLVGSAGVRSTRSFRGASQVHFVAESAVSEAVQRINGPGVVHWKNDVVDNWGAYWTGTKGFGPLAGFTYDATVWATPGNEADTGRITAVATGSEGVRNVVVANVLRTNIPATAPGAIYLAADATTNSNFSGNAFLVDGNDRNYSGGAGPGAPIPGISTRTDPNTQEAVDSLSGGQLDNVTGLGFAAGPPMVPSVRTSPSAPSTTQVGQIIDDLLARPGVVTWPDSQVNGNDHFGTEAAPQITHFPGDITIKGNGNADGAGIMIVDGDLTIKGTLDFKGLILVRGRTQVVGDTEFTGNATIYGSVWTNDINLVVGGSAVIQYSTEALALANAVGGGGALPSPIRVTSLVDCGLVPSGAYGCP
jgi:hypothetical protein